MLSDILPTGFEYGVLNGKVQPGCTVAIVGAGLIGLAALLTAQFYSPAAIIMVDLDGNRLDVAKRLGATTAVNSTDGKAVDTIMTLTNGRGVDTAIEAVGIPATFELCEKIIAAGGIIANIGVHGTKVELHLENLWDRNITITTQLVDVVSTPMLLNIRASKKSDHQQLTDLAHEKAALEISVAERIAELSAVNEALRIQAVALSKRNQEIALLSKMNDFLQTSTSEAEAYSVITETVTQLFPDDSGTVFVLSASRDVLEVAVAWGAMPPSNLVFPPGNCWAQRRGQSHLVLCHEQRCAHVTADGHMSVCLPLLAQGETLGILHVLDGIARHDETDEARMVEKCKLAKTLADNIGLGITNLKLRESMRNLSIRDPLTGLFNRRYMEEALAQEQHRVQRNKSKMAVIMIDIDHFKMFNDNFGHDGGDAVLRALGAFFQKHVRGSDIACRYGGEEFVLILSPSSAEGARQRAEKIRERAALLNITHANRDLGGITLSLGLAIFPDHALHAATIFKAADVALYQAKSSGRNRVVMFSADAAQTASAAS